jgi:hypothetical protein
VSAELTLIAFATTADDDRPLGVFLFRENMATCANTSIDQSVYPIIKWFLVFSLTANAQVPVVWGEAAQLPMPSLHESVLFFSNCLQFQLVGGFTLG